MKIGLAQWELNELVADLVAGKSWEEIERTRLAGVDPKAIAASDYREYAHRQAGIPIAEASPPADEVPQLVDEPAQDVETDSDREPQRGGRRKR